MTQTKFRNLVTSTQANMLEVVSTNIPILNIYYHWLEILRGGHSAAYDMGARRGGVTISEDDLLDIGTAFTDRESQWLEGFIHDLQRGRYTLSNGAYDLVKISNRISLYTSRLRGTANEALVEVGDAEIKWWWRLTALELHCTDCPLWAASSPFTRDVMPAFPGDGSTPCLGNCYCYLEREDGLLGFLSLTTDLSNFPNADSK